MEINLSGNDDRIKELKRKRKVMERIMKIEGDRKMEDIDSIDEEIERLKNSSSFKK